MNADIPRSMTISLRTRKQERVGGDRGGDADDKLSMELTEVWRSKERVQTIIFMMENSLPSCAIDAVEVFQTGTDTADGYGN